MMPLTSEVRCCPRAMFVASHEQGPLPPTSEVCLLTPTPTPTPPPTSDALASNAASALASDADADASDGLGFFHGGITRGTPYFLDISQGQDVLILNTGLGNEEDQKNIKELLQVEISGTAGDSDEQPLVSWLQDDRRKHEAIRLRHFKTVTSVEWHRKGDYLSTVTPVDILVV
ncbi:hypothetical protein NL676_016509 [Syzygium grande]|nr:hypothetical protein NL676_016509 [Syzygium grande]